MYQMNIDRYTVGMPQRSGLEPVGVIYLGMGHYIGIYMIDGKYVYFMLGGSDGTSRYISEREFQSADIPQGVSWTSLVEKLEKEYSKYM